MTESSEQPIIIEGTVVSGETTQVPEYSLPDATTSLPERRRLNAQIASAIVEYSKSEGAIAEVIEKDLEQAGVHKDWRDKRKWKGSENWRLKRQIDTVTSCYPQFVTVSRVDTKEPLPRSFYTRDSDVKQRTLNALATAVSVSQFQTRDFEEKVRFDESPGEYGVKSDAVNPKLIREMDEIYQELKSDTREKSGIKGPNLSLRAMVRKVTEST